MASDYAEAVDQQTGAEIEKDTNRAAVQKSPEEIRSELIETLSKTDLAEPTVGVLKNLVTADWVLANLDADDYREFKNRLESTKLRVMDMHPAPESEVTGRTRAYVNNRDDTLKPLSPQQKEMISEFFEGVRLRLTRSKNMEQQKVIRMRRIESNVNRGDDGGGQQRGVIGRWFG